MFDMTYLVRVMTKLIIIMSISQIINYVDILRTYVCLSVWQVTCGGVDLNPQIIR